MQLHQAFSEKYFEVSDSSNYLTPTQKAKRNIILNVFYQKNTKASVGSTSSNSPTPWSVVTRAQWTSPLKSGMSPIYSASPLHCDFASILGIGW